MATCNSSGHVAYKDFQAAWVDYDATIEASYLSLFPWGWKVQFNSFLVSNATLSSGSEYSCPTLAAKLVAFAVINIVVFIASCILGRRDVAYTLTCHCCGNPGSRTWPFFGLISIGLNLGANTINAAITKSTPGFQDVPIGGLILLWSSRPRMAWAVALLVRKEREESMYFSQALSAIMAEIVLQVVGSIYLGMTLNHARASGYLLLHHLEYTPHGQDAHIMYAGALLWMCVVGFVLLSAISIFTPASRLIGEGVVGVSMKLHKLSGKQPPQGHDPIPDAFAADDIPLQSPVG